MQDAHHLHRLSLVRYMHQVWSIVYFPEAYQSPPRDRRTAPHFLIKDLMPSGARQCGIMAIIDVVKWEMDSSDFCFRFPSENLRLGTQLVVYPGQRAFFVKGGQVYDEFSSGTYTIHSGNIPLLTGLLSLPFGGDTPFQAEVWFVNLTVKPDFRWGTAHPMQLEDSRYDIIFPVRAYGRYGVRITDSKRFLETIIGNMSRFSQESLEEYLRGKIISHLSSLVAKRIVEENISVLDISVHLVEMSEYCNEELNEVFGKYGVSLVDFSIMAVSIPQDDPSLVKLKEAKDMAARLRITGRDVYQMEKSFDVLEKVASNEGAGGQFAAMGAGLGVGFGTGKAMGNVASGIMNTGVQPPPLNVRYHIYVNGVQKGNLTFPEVSEMILSGQASAETLVWTAGMPAWIRLGEMQEFAVCFSNMTPPPLPL